MSKFSAAWLVFVLGWGMTSAQVFLDLPPSNRSASGQYSPRNLGLGQPRFTNPELYNLYDQGNSPLGLLESVRERLSLSLGFMNSGRSTDGDSLEISHGDFALPQLAFSQPGIFAAVLYFHRESESYLRKSGDSLEVGKSRFGLDFAAGPSSGIFRIGFGAHAALGALEYPGAPERILIDLPSLRLDVGSRLHPALEVGAFAGISARFDSLDKAPNQLERVAELTMPRYGFLADFGGPDFPLRGNAVLEFGTRIFMGEFKPVNSGGQAYPTLLNGYWEMQTQWMATAQIREFRLQPALRFAHRSEDAQGYQGIISNQNPLRKGAKIDSMAWQRGITDFGLGANFGFREMLSLLWEWETSGHTFETDTTVEKRYHRFMVGAEHQVDAWSALRFPQGFRLALRAGWSWRQEEKGAPGHQPFHFDPFVPTIPVPTRLGEIFPFPDDPAGIGAFNLGFTLGLLEERIGLEGLLSFPGQLERTAVNRSAEASGTEFGLTARYRIP